MDANHLERNGTLNPGTLIHIYIILHNIYIYIIYIIYIIILYIYMLHTLHLGRKKNDNRNDM